MVMAAVRSALLKHLRVAAAAPSPSPAAALFSGDRIAALLRRGFSEEVKGSFLDKDEVRDRIIKVVKNFEKVDPSKKVWTHKKPAFSRAVFKKAQGAPRRKGLLEPRRKAQGAGARLREGVKCRDLEI